MDLKNVFFTLGQLKTLFFSLILIALCEVTFATPLEDGKAAYLEKDYAKALEILKPLAEEGDSEAQVTLGIMYDYGHGVEANPAEAFKWYEKAAEQGIPVVQHDLGVKYFQGIGVEQDYAKATKWWTLSSEAGLADSQFNLGLMYYRGLGHEQNFAKAKTLFEKAADQGHGHAQYSLAVIHAFGQGVESDYTTALKWFNKAAEQDIAQAQYNLGVFYENGYGVESDIDTARFWYEKAAQQKLAEAQSKLENLEAENTAVEKPDVATSNTVNKEPVAQTTTEPEPEPEPEPKRIPVAPESATKVAATQEPTTSTNPPADIKSSDWVLAQNPDNYTVQIGSSGSESGAIKFLKQYTFSHETAYIRVFVKEAFRYSILYGNFSSSADANAAISNLPQVIKNTKPWVRKFSTVQNLIQN